MKPDATERRPERHHRSCSLSMEKVGGKIAKSRWNQPPDWHSDLHLRTSHTTKAANPVRIRGFCIYRVLW